MLEPAARRRSTRRALATAEWARVESAYVHDAQTNHWWTVGDAAELPPLDDLAAAAPPEPPRFDGPLRSQLGREAYIAAVARAVEYIRAGDVFQVNLTHHLAGMMHGSPRALFAALAESAAPWYGAYLDTPAGVVASASPELFLDYDPATRRIITRPMKGTRAGEHGAAALLSSEKDAAELNMIVDLMRNDLGRVCDFGSIRVDAPREIESHGAPPTPHRNGTSGGVLQGVATVSGTLRKDLGLNDLLRAAFPPGSITGAPKVRAMQIINELEPAPRGPYCGCVGFISDSGHAQLSVAIRTAALSRRIAANPPAAPGESWVVRYGVGAGIVADSDPHGEWRETLVKARIWRGIADIAEE